RAALDGGRAEPHAGRGSLLREQALELIGRDQLLGKQDLAELLFFSGSAHQITRVAPLRDGIPTPAVWTHSWAGVGLPSLRCAPRVVALLRDGTPTGSAPMVARRGPPVQSLRGLR